MSASSDNPNELFDLVDADDRVVGKVRRGDAHGNPELIHRSVQVLVFSRDGRLLLQKRSPAKDLFPGYYCASASGHVDAGEDYDTTAAREVHEELGVTLQLAFLGKTLVRSTPETEITAIYLGQSDGPFQFHPGETSGGMFMALPDVLVGRETGAILMTPALLAALAELERSELAGGFEGLLNGL